MTAIAQYVFDGAEVRVIVGEDGEPWFVAADVAQVLGYLEAYDMTRSLDDADKGPRPVRTLGGTQTVTVISEGGLFQAVVQRQTGRILDEQQRSRVKRFQRWVTHEVLPSIRKTGAYGQQDALAALSDPATLRQLLGSYAERVEALEAGAAAARPKVEVYDRIVDAGDTFGFREAAKLIREGTGASEREVMTLMLRRGWVQRLGTRPAPTSIGRERGYTTSRMSEWTDRDGVTHVKPELRITPKGIARAIKLLNTEAA